LQFYFELHTNQPSQIKLVACTGSNVAKGFLTYISHALILQKTWSNAVSGKSSEDMWHKQAELVLPWSI
jgi:hypothetical protein